MTNERGNTLRQVHMLSSPAIPEPPNVELGGWWQSQTREASGADPTGLSGGERSEVSRTPESGPGDYPIILEPL